MNHHVCRKGRGNEGNLGARREKKYGEGVNKRKRAGEVMGVRE